MRTLMFTYNGWEYPVLCYPQGDGWLGQAELPPGEHGRPLLVRLSIPPVGQVQVTLLEGAAEIEQSRLPTLAACDGYASQRGELELCSLR